jgi:hypothetical protein
MAYILFYHRPDEFNFSDMANYIRIAKDIQLGFWSENHFFQPIGFPILLALIKTWFNNWSMALANLQVKVSTLSLYLVWKVADETLGPKVAKYSLILSAFHLPFIINNGFALAETFFGFFSLCPSFFKLQDS